MKKFSVLSWNVEQFTTSGSSVNDVVDHILPKQPDVMAIMEVRGKDVFSEMVSEFSGYNFHITEGQAMQKILVGVKGEFTAFITQREKFRTKNPDLRPGVLLTLHINDENYSMLFLHNKSWPTPDGFGRRDEQFNQSYKLKAKLDETAGGENLAKFMVVGDLNTMGMKYRYGKTIDGETELRNLDADISSRGMRRLAKDYESTWGNSSGDQSNLDHVLATTNLNFKKDSNYNEVQVSGWRELSGQDRLDFIENTSDHNSLYFEVE